MIRISIENIYLLYFSAAIVVILITAYIERHSKQAVVVDRIVVNCPVCAYHYIVNITEKMHRCPQCESLNTQKGADEKNRR